MPFRSAGSRLRFYNRPRFVDGKSYEQVLGAVVTRLRREPAVVAVYQLGGTSAPGISDLDVLAVFEDGARVDADALDSLDPVGRYVFTHGAFGISRSLLPDALRYGVYDGLRLIDGEDLLRGNNPVSASDPQIKRQTALEFLLMNYIARTIDARYGAASLRNVLLSSHAIRFDLDLLGLAAHPVRDCTARIVEWRRRWFDEPVSDDELRDWWDAFVPALEKLLIAELTAEPIALPQRHRERLARHIRIRPGNALRVGHRGVTLPSWSVRGKRHGRLQNRLNRFHVGLPAAVSSTGTVLHDRFEFCRRAIEDARSRYPRFTPLLNNFAANVV